VASITRLSAERLGLAAGVPVYVMIKAVALDREEPSRAGRRSKPAAGSVEPSPRERAGEPVTRPAGTSAPGRP